MHRLVIDIFHGMLPRQSNESGKNSWDMGDQRDVYKILSGKSELRSRYGRFRCKWQNNNKMVLKEENFYGVKWKVQVQDKKDRQVTVHVAMKVRPLNKESD